MLLTDKFCFIIQIIYLVDIENIDLIGQCEKLTMPFSQLGVAAGFIIPPLLIENNCTHLSEITHELTILTYPVAVINTVLFIVLILGKKK